MKSNDNYTPPKKKKKFHFVIKAWKSCCRTPIPFGIEWHSTGKVHIFFPIFFLSRIGCWRWYASRTKPATMMHSPPAPPLLSLSEWKFIRGVVNKQMHSRAFERTSGHECNSAAAPINVFGSEYSYCLYRAAGHWIKISIISHLLVERMEKCEWRRDRKKKRIEKHIYKFCCTRIEMKGYREKTKYRSSSWRIATCNRIPVFI